MAMGPPDLATKEPNMQTTYSEIDGAALTIRRPGGEIEAVINRQHARKGVIPAELFAKMVAANRGAGRGELLGQTPNVVERTISLDMQREMIAGPLSDCAGAFPGSAQWSKAQSLEQQLAEFDAAHPEVLAAINAARAERTTSGAARALRMED